MLFGSGWNPGGEEILNDASKSILKILEETGTKTELWVSFPGQVFEGLSDEEQLAQGCGDPDRGPGQGREESDVPWPCTTMEIGLGNLKIRYRIIEAIGSEKIRIVYNFHHGHHQVDRFEELLDLMLPYLSAININGMKAEGPKIITLGEGDRELEMLKIIKASGYNGPIGILGHTEGEDIRLVLERNLEGLENSGHEYSQDSALASWQLSGHYFFKECSLPGGGVVPVGEHIRATSQDRNTRPPRKFPFPP